MPLPVPALSFYLSKFEANSLQMKTTLLKTLIAVCGFYISASAQIPSYLPSNGLVGWWPFNGNANDLSPSANHATVNGAVLTADRYGNNNSAYNCNSGYLYSSTTAHIPRGGTMSIAAWFNTSSNFGIGEFMCLGSHSNTYWGAVGGNNAFTVNYGRGCGSTGSSLQNIGLDNGSWHHVVFVSTGTGGTARVYYDGYYFGTSTTASTGGFCSTTGLYIGHDAYFGQNYPGSLDDIGIWDRALTDCEVWDIFTETAGTAFTTHPLSQTSGLYNTVKFSVASSYPGASFQWQTNTGSGFINVTNGGQYSGATSDTLIVSNTALGNNNQQFRCAIVSPSCTTVSNTATLTVINNVGIRNHSVDYFFSVYPNPFFTSLNLKVETNFIGSTYTLYDYTGKTIMIGKIQQENTSIDAENLAAGIYLLAVGTDNKHGIKIIKE